MVFYRKYRPQIIEELDNEQVRKTLTSLLTGDALPHAFLFTGPKGLGKTSTARIVAKAVNCERRQGKDVEPCNECEQCLSITNGSNVDILEIDGASNRGIDEIRDLREKLRLAPLSAKKKIYIIDEVHMLTTEAFNALLKTLEEPPSHVVFILCTTEHHKVPATILSRCMHILFHKATTEELVRSFRRIATGEKLQVDDETLKIIASLSDGGFRDGAKVLEELARNVPDGKITRELLEQTYHTVSIHHEVEALLGHMAKRETKEAILLITRLAEQGRDIKYFIEQVSQVLHAMLLEKVGIASGKPLPSVNLSLVEIQLLLSACMKTYGDIKYAIVPQLPLEIMVIAWGERGQEGGLPSPAVREKPQVASLPVKKAPEEKIIAKEKKEANLLYTLIDHVKGKNPSLAGVLRGCTSATINGTTLVIETAFTFHKERLADAKSREFLQQAAADISGQTLTISVVLKTEKGGE